MSKKWIAVLMMMTFTCVPVLGTADITVSGTDNRVTLNKTNEQGKSMYITRTGEITNISKNGDDLEILVGDAVNGTRFILQPGNIILDAETLQMKRPEDLKLGMSVSTVINKNAPMTMSLPPLCSSQTAFVIHSSKKNIEIAYFDENLTNEANSLKLNISEDTMIQNSRGEKRVFTAEDIKNQDAIVIYTNSTRSIPAQTVPEYVLILCGDEEREEASETDKAPEVNTIEDSYMAVREVAKQLGYEVNWDNMHKAVELTKDKCRVKLAVGGSIYTYNEEIRELKSGVKLESGTVYVPEELYEVLK